MKAAVVTENGIGVLVRPVLLPVFYPVVSGCTNQAPLVGGMH